MAVYIQQAYKALKDIAPNKRVVISGWGGDKWLRFTDLFPGLDESLPKDVIFSALDNIDPSWEPNVSQFYGKSAGRPRALGHSVVGVGRRRHTARSVHAAVQREAVLGAAAGRDRRRAARESSESTGASRAVEDVARYMVDFAWNPQKTNYESFCVRFRPALLRRSRCTGDEQDLDGVGSAWSKVDRRRRAE